jgi:glutaredoxin
MENELGESAEKPLEEKNIKFMYVDISNQSNLEMFLKLGYKSVPILQYGGIELVGFDRTQYEEIFSENSNS